MSLNYAKLIDGRLEYAPKTISKENKHYNPYPENMMIADGYKKLIYTTAPISAMGFHPAPHWEDRMDKIVQVWEIVEDEPIEPTPEERTAAIVDYNVMMGILEDPEAEV